MLPLVEYGGKRILFDTGNNPDILAHNAQVKGIDLSKLDFVVMSHRHGDHMGGLSYVLKVNPSGEDLRPQGGVRGLRCGLAEHVSIARTPSLPPEQRYYDGAPPDSHAIRVGLARSELSTGGQRTPRSLPTCT